ncbi:class A beta-lactamase [Streptomyces sp. AD55]|uniref:class A beta-lactamase n=1 Tax=Streptomyces sp. AD55 TaxID=3242895 RepID=UPI003528F6D3
MDGARTSPSRRGVLVLGAGTALGAALPPGGTAHASVRDGTGARLRELEERHAARLGVYAHDTATGRTVRYRADERFPLCSVFKTLAVAAVLRDLDRDGEFLGRNIRYTERDVTEAGHAPVTGEPRHLAAGMTVGALCSAAIRHSDNAAANLLLAELGGPPAVTRFCRSIGDGTTRLDRREPELNSAEPWRTTDTTSPEAVGRSYARLLLGTALGRGDRALLTGWLLANTTGDEKLRAGLPADWAVAEKTGSGGYGTGHDVGVAWPPGRAPLVLAVLTSGTEPDAVADSALIAGTAALLARTLT